MPFAEGFDRVEVLQVDVRNWQLRWSLVYRGEEHGIAVPAGYVTDFASVPRMFSWLIPAFGIYTRAAIVHDYLITDILPKQAHLEVPEFTSRDVDGIFRRILRELGVPVTRRWLMWAGVRLGALANPRRRGGWKWLKDAPAVLAIGVLASPFLAVGVVVQLALWLNWLIERVGPDKPGRTTKL